MITKDMKLVDIINANYQSPQVFMTLRIGCGKNNTNENMTLEEACVRHGVNLEYALRRLNFRSFY